VLGKGDDPVEADHRQSSDKIKEKGF